ncbi:MAG: fibrobacter succinogenes major paralogous domain-containing protein, partial [Candidatus Marinimicrobia bacterium]|nr:fibrobacter succinogenes major paralogous domain-containing protein [Candidatus Neomarinimicrobiota bacterium]
SALADVVDWTSNSSDTSVTKTGLTLTEGSTYYVSVRATDTDSQVSDTTTTDGVTIDVTAPIISVVIEGVGVPIVTDIDGNVYQTVEIGNQLWMKENLKVTHYNNGDVIPTGYSDSEWQGLSTGAYAVYNDDPSNAETYGNLYNWYAVNTGNLAPEGWHVPTDDEIKTLEIHLGMNQGEADGTNWRGSNEGSKLAGREDLWNDGALENDLEFGTSDFIALPGGFRTHMGIYDNMGNYGYVLSSTEYNSSRMWFRILFSQDSRVSRGYDRKRLGLSVRFIKDVDYLIISDADYQNNDSELIISWSGTDDASGIAQYEYALGTTSGGTETLDWTSAGTSTMDTLTGLLLSEGSTYYLSVRATDIADNISDIASGDGIVIDLTSPFLGSVQDGPDGDLVYTPDINSLYAEWGGFSDALSGIEFYEYAVGTTSGGAQIVDWVNTGTDSSVTITGLILTDDVSYYISVRATDYAGNVSDAASSNGIIVDTEPPVVGTVWDGLTEDNEWSNSATTLSGYWFDFTDAVSGLQYYEYAIGDSPEDSNTVDWMNNELETAFIREDLTLQSGSTYYISVRATDLVNNTSAVSISNGIIVDQFSPTVSDPFDGVDSTLSEDLDWQQDNTTLIAAWQGNDTREIAYYEYSFGTAQGDSNVVSWTDNGTNTDATVTGLS